MRQKLGLKSFFSISLFCGLVWSAFAQEQNNPGSWAKRKLVADSADKASVREIFFATSRPSYQRKDGSLYVYNELNYEEPTESPTLGVATVYFPKAIHKKGQLERSKEDKESFRILTLRQEQAAPLTSKRILVFVHGFNNDFNDALLQSAQLSEDLNWANDFMISYSWLSRGSVVMYLNDRGFLDREGLCLARFLHKLILANPNTEINLLAHSMGNEVTLRALSLLKETLEKNQRPSQNIFRNLFFAAPDVSVEDFYEYLPLATSLAFKSTHYFSTKDLPIALSPFANWGKERAGGQPIYHEFLDSIDTDAINSVEVGLGHSYFAASGAVLSDIESLLKDSRLLLLDPNIRTSVPNWEQVKGALGTHWKMGR